MSDTSTANVCPTCKRIMENLSATTPAPVTEPEEADYAAARRAVDASIEIIKRAAANKPDQTDDEIVYGCATGTEGLKKLIVGEADGLETVVWSNYMNLGEWNSIMLPRNCDCLYAIKNCRKKPVYLELTIGDFKFPRVRVEPGNIEWLFEGMPVILVGLMYTSVRITLKDEDGNVVNGTDHIDVCGCAIELYGSFVSSPARRAMIEGGCFVSCQTNKPYRLLSGMFSPMENFRTHGQWTLETFLESKNNPKYYFSLSPLQSVDVKAQTIAYQRVKQLIDADMDILCAHANDATDSDELREDLGKWSREKLCEMFAKEPDRQSFVCSRFYASNNWTHLELPKNYDCIYAIRNCGRQPVFAQFQFGEEKFPSFRIEPKTTQWLFDGMPILLLLAPHRNFYLTLFYENGHIIKHGYGIELFGAYWCSDIRRQLVADTSAKYFVSTRMNKTYMLQRSEFGMCSPKFQPAPEDEPHTHRSTTKTFRGQPEADAATSKLGT